MNSLFADANVISVYTREQAINDGYLVDVSVTAKEAGFRIPTVVTRAVWDAFVAWSEEDTKRQTYQDESGRLWDVLWMGHLAAARKPSSSQIIYSLYCVPCGGRGRKARLKQLKLHVGPDDTGEPVITIMLPNED